MASLVDLRRRLRAVLDIIAAIGRSGFTVSRGLELYSSVEFCCCYWATG